MVSELKKTVYGQSIRVITLASRQQYCINPAVRALKSNALINERCLELKKVKSNVKKLQCDETERPAKKSKVSGENSNKSCEFYAQQAIQNVACATLYRSDGILDIEQIIEEAKKEKGCPYYASRVSAKDAQVVMLPYQMLLHKKTRDQLNINIRNAVIIIDEAHNLLDIISNIHSAELSQSQLQATHRQLIAYKTKYLDRFSAKSLLRLNQLISIVHRFVRLLLEPTDASANATSTEFATKMIYVHELLDDANISVGTLFEITNFCESTKLASKLTGFATRYSGEIERLNQKDKPQVKVKATHSFYLQKLAEKRSTITNEQAKIEENANMTTSTSENQFIGMNSILRNVISFLECLLEKSVDGRILISRHRSLQSKSFVKYLLLNPNGPFDLLLRECRAVIVAGGTMQPTVEFKSQLFQSFSERIEEHFFGHVVDSTAVLPIVVAKGPRGISFNFNYANRNNIEMVCTLFTQNSPLFYFFS